MYSLNRVELIGYQTQPLAVRKTPGGTSVADLNLVVPHAFQGSRGDAVNGKSFHTVTLWGALADVAGQYVRPGSQIFIAGRLQTDSWEDPEKGEKRSKTKVIAQEMILLDSREGQAPAPRDASLVCSSLNRASIIGNATKEPELRTTTSGQSVLSLGVATNERWKDKASTEWKERTEFHNVVIWGDLAKQVQACLKKGQKVFVAGRVQTRTWETQTGQKRATTEIIAEQVSLLGIQNADAQASIQADGAPRDSFASSPAPTPSLSVAPQEIPPVKYESEIKPEDLPF